MFKRRACVDLGATATRIFVSGRGVVLREPSVVALDRETNEVVAVGQNVAQLEESASLTTVTVRPLRDGMVSDDGLAGTLLTAFLRRAKLGSDVARLIICTPTAVAEAETHAVLNVVREVARETLVLEPPLAAALGAGLSANDAGKVVVDIGGGTTDIALISRQAVFAAESLRAAGDEFDEAIVRLMRQKGVLIGGWTAEEVKLELGAALLPSAEAGQPRAVRGRDISTGTPKTISVRTEEVVEALQGPLRSVARGVHKVLEAAPPDLAAYVVDNGVVLTGGGALLPYLDTFLQQQIGIPVALAEHPADCTILGLGRALDLPDLHVSRTP